MNAAAVPSEKSRRVDPNPRANEKVRFIAMIATTIM